MKKGPSRQSNRKPSGQQKKTKVAGSSSLSFKQQNMKEFKMQIDHEIAKCLDTIDRQGLKYLKQTLRSSTLFNDEITTKTKNISPTKNKGDPIQEEIVQELDNNVEQPNINTITDLVIPDKVPEIKKQSEVKLEKFEEKFQEPLKPFSRKSSSRQAFQIETEPKQERQSKIKKEMSQSKKQKGSKQIKDKSQIDEILQKISQFPGKKLDILNKLIDQLEQSQKIDNPLGLTKPYVFKPEQQIVISNPSAIKSTVNKNKNNEKATSLYDSLIKGGRRSPLYSKEEKKSENSKTQSFFKNSQMDSDLKQIEIGEEIQDLEIENMKSEQKQAKEQKANSSFKQPLFRQSQTQVDKKVPQIKKTNFLKAFSISNMKKPLDIEITESQQVQASDIINGQQSKMVRLGKKKLGTNTLRFVLVNNRGHPSIVGLTCINIYNTLGKPIQIKIQNIKSQNTPKLMKLFNGTYQTTDEEQMFTALKKNAQIELEINEKIGGMKIWNYNKSEIESSKQTDEVDFYINDKLTWKGSIKKGSYNELVDYCTEIKLEEDFEFEMVKKYEFKENEKQERMFVLPQNMKESFHNQDQISKKTDSFIHQSQFQKDSQFIAPKIKHFNQSNHTNRFSQVFNIKNIDQKRDESKTETNDLIDAKTQQKSNEKFFIKQMALNKASKQQFSKEKTARSNSKKFEDEIDIFTSLGPNAKKVNQKTPINLPLQLNNDKKVGEKNSEEVIKKSSLGFSSLINNEQKSETVLKKVEIEQKKLNLKPPQQSFDDFMNDSLFQEPKRSTNEKKIKGSISNSSKQQKSQKSSIIEEKTQKYDNTNKVNIDDILNDLNDLVGSTAEKYQNQNAKNKKVTIPELPKGTKMEIILMTNWGDNEWMGLNKIQFFDSSGQMIFPIEAKSSNKISVVELFSKTFNIEQSSQWKCKTKQAIKICLSFSKKFQFSFIRFWNFVGDRIHSMCGVRKIEIILDGSVIFVGDIRKSAGHSRDEIFKSCESILFTNNPQIQNKILQNDWLTQELQSWKQQKLYFKKTSENFMRPSTNGSNTSNSLKIVQTKEEIKLPKRNCYQYDPPSNPSGYFIKLILHSTWGDMNFVGLNGITVFDENGDEIKSIKKVSEYPAPLANLAGYEKDKRTLSNLFNGRNQTADEENIWLAPYLRDVDKMQKNNSNTILIEFEKAIVVSGINFYNYVKTPQRGVRQIEIHVDEHILYRGYLKIAKPETGEIHTTINFTKETSLLEKINYSGYHEDNFGQDVKFWNEGKPQKITIS